MPCLECCRSSTCSPRWRICLLPLVKGARVVYLETLNTTELLRALNERQITIFAVVPQFFYLIHERIFKEVAKRGTGGGLGAEGSDDDQSRSARGRHSTPAESSSASCTAHSATGCVT